MSGEITLDYTDVLKAYQNKSGELLTQLITTEARLSASTSIISDLKKRISELEVENEKLKKSTSRTKKLQTEKVVDYNS